MNNLTDDANSFKWDNSETERGRGLHIPNTSWQENGPQSKQKPLVTWKVEINLVIVLLTFLALVTRLWNLGTPREIVFDEVHFGQFTALYLKRTFFFDVHPPLGKLLFTAVGYFAGFDENFVFAKIGAEYPVNVPVWHLRALSALFGTFLCPVVYQIIAELGFSHWSAMLAGFLVLFDNAILVQSRFILLDSMLLFFSMMSILSLLKFRNLKNR
ncbi:protein O-mannosyl-transferase 1-like [Saccoglossus kowalevskii]